MKVKKLEINNFRGFRKAVIEFPDSNLAVFIGTNGKGKSSVLDLVAMFLNQLTSEFQHALANRVYQLTSTDVNNLSEKTESAITIEQGNKEMKWWDSYHKSAIPAENLIIGDEFDSLVSTACQNLTDKKEKANLPIILYLRANRFFNNNYEPSKDEPRYKFPQLSVYENAFSQRITDFNDFVNWFRIEEDKENELIKKERNFDLVSPKLQVIRKAIKTYFSNLNGFVFSNLRIERDLANSQNFASAGFASSLVITKNDQDLRLEQLSDGEKMLLMVVCDIARRLTIANPSLPDPLEGRGIVLIDEIELHLHPKWQREVIPALLTTFPNIQFLITTHSPQVLSRVGKEDIFLLENGEVFKLSSDPKGLDTNAILEEIMDTPKYPRHVDELVDELFTLIQLKKFDQASTVRKKIVKETSSDFPILRQADSMMERLKVLSQ